MAISKYATDRNFQEQPAFLKALNTVEPEDNPTFLKELGNL